MQVWGRDRAPELVAIVDAAMPSENLSEDELVACLWEDVDPTVVVAPERGSAVAAAVIRDTPRGRVAFLQLLAVTPADQRKGHGRALMNHVRSWAFDENDAVALSVGGGAPFYLWPGVDAMATPALCLFEALGFRPTTADCNMSFPSRHRAPLPAGLDLRRVLDDADVTATRAFVEAHWPNWVAETMRAVDHGACHVAISKADGAIVGFGCHSVNRLGWLGPMGTDPERRHGGLGNALLGAIATDVMAAGFATVEVAWVGPLGFYANAAGATVSRTFRRFVLSRPE